MKHLTPILFSTILILFTTTDNRANPVDDLFAAAKQCDVSGVQAALDGGADANAIDPASGQNALASAFFCPDVTKLLLAKGCDPNGGVLPCHNQCGQWLFSRGT